MLYSKISPFRITAERDTLNKKENISLQQLAQNLAAFALDRTDLKQLMNGIPKDTGLNLTAIEYELQILKILSVGWAVSFFMPAVDKNKTLLSQGFWECIREVSQNISTLTETTTGQEIDYFEILKKRLEVYIRMMKENQAGGSNPADIMGPAFAFVCGHKDDAVAVLTGTKMFTLTLGGVKEYLNSVEIQDVTIN